MNKVDARAILESRAVISKAGKFTVKVSSVTHGHVRATSGQVVDIVNFGAMTAFQAKEAVTAFKEGDFVKATSKSLSTSLLSGMYVPTKGEIVDIEVAEIFSEKADANILVVSSVIKRQSESTSKFSLDLDDEEVDAIADARAESALV